MYFDTSSGQVADIVIDQEYFCKTTYGTQIIILESNAPL